MRKSVERWFPPWWVWCWFSRNLWQYTWTHWVFHIRGEWLLLVSSGQSPKILLKSQLYNKTYKLMQANHFKKGEANTRYDDYQKSGRTHQKLSMNTQELQEYSENNNGITQSFSLVPSLQRILLFLSVPLVIDGTSCYVTPILELISP